MVPDAAENGNGPPPPPDGACGNDHGRRSPIVRRPLNRNRNENNDGPKQFLSRFFKKADTVKIGDKVDIEMGNVESEPKKV